MRQQSTRRPRHQTGSGQAFGLYATQPRPCDSELVAHAGRHFRFRISSLTSAQTQPAVPLFTAFVD